MKEPDGIFVLEDGVAFDDFAFDDFTAETRAADCRTHRALGLTPAVAPGISDLLSQLWPLLARALQVHDPSADAVPLLGSGCMVVRPGALAQELHKDVHAHDRFVVPPSQRGADRCADAATAGGPRAISIQLQLSDTTRADGDDAPTLGSLEVLPGSHRPDAAAGSEAAIRAALDDEAGAEARVLPVDVPPGSVTLYSSRLWHRGGANGDPTRERAFAFLTLSEPDAPAPPGLIHTMARDDVGRWRVTKQGLVRERWSRSRSA